ncbi:hydroxysqualene dehydroxylase HpnE [Tepidimonas charontis]|uniref:HpnE: squalene-associated FAD-dependent desaturase n=1 Tax=Tepidimonas charontis TaxID=2267262 RepID=A0A554XK04_9BURK|nr:hydroxysqualene dehydroxylase HpnE [Tepidimonas charontis]TSE36149.1 HpnE: squalene-associated FAD-dependent desaturase [Tepidimonas charontis]
MSGRRLTIVGGGWAGLAAAVAAADTGWQVTVLEAARHWGGRARRLTVRDADGAAWFLDNGQHLLIGAYTATLGLLRRLGVVPQACVQRLPLTLRTPQGDGVALPRWGAHLPAALAPLAVAVGLLGARGWTLRERLATLQVTLRWQRQGFACTPATTVADLCAPLPERVRRELFELLCVAALNTPPAQASGAVFLRVLHDALLGSTPPPYAASDLLVPRVDLGALLPDAAVAALRRRGARPLTGARAVALQHGDTDARWQVRLADGTTLSSDAVVLACPVWEAARLLAPLGADEDPIRRWCASARALTHLPIATVYLRPPPQWRWPATAPLLALRSDPASAPAQFVFWHRRMGAPSPYLAWVASAPEPALATDREALTRAVQAQARTQLGLAHTEPLLTVIEKRATFACTAGLQRPPATIAPGLMAAGDAIDGPYPATLEGAVRSGLAAAAALSAAFSV